MNISKKVLIPAAILLVLLTVGGIVLLFLQPERLAFWDHVNAHTRYNELQQQYNPEPEGWVINYISVHHKETPDSEFSHVELEDEAKIAELVDILSDIKVIDKPREEREFGSYTYSLYIDHPNYMDVIIDFDEDLDEMWIVFSLMNPPAYKIKNTSAFREYLEELFKSY